MTGRKHGDASRLTVYVDARTGRVLTTKEHVLEGTGNGNWEGTVTIPTTGSGSSFSMTNSNASTLKCQNAVGQRDVHRHRRRVGQRQRDRPRDRLRRRVLLGREDAPDDVDLAGPQRHERLGRLGADPGRPQRRQRLLRRHPGPDRPHARPATSGSARSTWSPTSSATASTTRRPGGISGGGTQEFVGRHLRRGDRVLRQQPGRRARLHRRRGGQPGRPGPDPQHVQPVRGRRPQLLLAARSRAPRCTRRPVRATTGSTCCRRAPTRPAARPARPATARR